MRNALSNNDYIDILKYYKIQVTPTMSKKTIKDLAESILANKLCKCIKSIQKSNKSIKENKAIPICKTSVLTRKKLHSFRFTCKKKPRFLPKKNSSIKLSKLKLN
jgi:hypothetical protein